MNEKELHKAWGIQDEEEYTPFLSRKSSSHKHIVPTLQNHIKPSTTQQIKINIVDKPKKIKREPTRIKLSKEQRRINKIATQKRWYRNVVKRDSGREVKDREYMSLDGLTDEQKKARRAEQKRACRKRQKEKINNEEDPRRSVC
ncbi:MAG: hypothetical protein WC464_00270 [Bdellovibrionales bacterium]|jgi:hypothetical protein